MKRTCPDPVFNLRLIKDLLIRVLFIWTIRHPASGYVQGINDIAAMFAYLFLADTISLDKRDAHDSVSLNTANGEGINGDDMVDAYALTVEDMSELS